MAPAACSSCPPAAEAWAPMGSRQLAKPLFSFPASLSAPKKLRSMSDVLARSHYAPVEREDYSGVRCEQCGSGDKPKEMLLCDKCDRGFHMKCLRPIVFRIPNGSWACYQCSGYKRVTRLSQKKIVDFFRLQKNDGIRMDFCSQDSRKRRKRSGLVAYQKKRRRLLPYVPSNCRDQRLKQMGSLANALTSLKMEFSDALTYFPGMVSVSANQAKLEEGGMQVLSKEDTETLTQCKAMSTRGECAPLLVVFDSREGYTVEADDPIRDMTFIAEYTGDVDYIRNRENDDCDSMMTLLLAENSSRSLVICPDKRGNVARFVNGINNYTPDGKKKQNCKCVRYDVNGECRVFLVATRDIAKGERLYYDYNGYEHEYPTENFV